MWRGAGGRRSLHDDLPAGRAEPRALLENSIRRSGPEPSSVADDTTQAPQPASAEEAFPSLHQLMSGRFASKGLVETRTVSDATCSKWN